MKAATLTALALSLFATAAAQPGHAGPVAPRQAALPPLDYDASLWNWNARWFASEWGNGMSPIPGRYDHVIRRGNDIVLRLDAAGLGEIQGMNGTPARKNGLWEVDVTLPKARTGVVIAPLWLLDNASRDEIDFEVVGASGGIDVTMHIAGKQIVGTKILAGQDLSGRRVRLGIRVDQDLGNVDMIVNGRIEHRFDRDMQPAGFVRNALKPWFNMWPADPAKSWLVQWAGRFQRFAPAENMQMTIHGYRYTAM